MRRIGRVNQQMLARIGEHAGYITANSINPGGFTASNASASVYTTDRPGGWSPAYWEGGEYETPIAAVAPRGEWQEKEIVDGLRIAVQKGRRWKAERLDTGQVLLTPESGRPRGHRGASSGGVQVGALVRDTDGATQEIDDPIPQRKGRRW